MKIIELLDKMATGEISTETKVNYKNARKIHKNWESLDYYIYQEFGKRSELEIKDFLNDEIEIIEEDKKINFEEIEELTCNSYDFKTITINQLIKNQKKIIYEVNRLKGEK